MRGQFKEQASLEEYRRAGACPRRLFIQRPQGEFRRLRAASDFLDGQKVTKEPLGGGRNRRFGKASRLHAARPLEPPLRGTRTC